MRISLPSNRAFASFEEARALIHGDKLPVNTRLFWSHGFFDAHLEYPVVSVDSRFSVWMRAAPGMGDRLKLVLRFLPLQGEPRALEIHSEMGRVELDPHWYQAASLFVVSGFEHILGGIDHLLFLLCLVVPFRNLRSLIWIVTSFTLAHSITLIGAAYGLAPSAPWFPALVETLIAASILYMAIENVVAASLRRRWLVTFAFGLVHGFGFSFALTETLQFAGSHLLASLLAFNLGVELGQVLVLLVLVPSLSILFRYMLAERAGNILLSVIVGHTAWDWMIARWETLGAFPVVQGLGSGTVLLVIPALALIAGGVQLVKRIPTLPWRDLLPRGAASRTSSEGEGNRP